MDTGAQIGALKASFQRQTAPLEKRRVSKTRVGEILGLEASSILDDLLSFGLILLRPVQGV
jgi:hypothetical protein